MAILNDNKASRMEIAEVKEKYELPSGDVRYKVSIYKKNYDCIPLTGAIFKPGDKVICFFQDSKNEDTPFIVGKFNQKNMEEEELIADIKPIEKKKDTDSFKYETKDSIIQMDDKSKKITIANKNSELGKIILDNNSVIVGDVNLTDLIADLKQFKNTGSNDQTVSSERSMNFKTEEGGFKINAQEFVSITDNFIVNNNNEMTIQTNHINFSSSFVEFNVISPKGYNLKEKNSFSFFAVTGNYSISLGTGDFNLKAVSPASEFNFLIMPSTPFSGLGSSMAGMIITSTETTIANLYELNSIILDKKSFTASVLNGLGELNLKSNQFVIDLIFGVLNLTLKANSFSVDIGGNKLTLDPLGLTISKGNIEATQGDVLAKGGTYSLSRHKHPTAVPGGPSPPLPG